MEGISGVESIYLVSGEEDVYLVNEREEYLVGKGRNLMRNRGIIHCGREVSSIRRDCGRNLLVIGREKYSVSEKYIEYLVGR
jgi:hypothetical protein